jgi:hypothetical protein
MLKNTSRLGGGTSTNIIWGETMKREREKGGKCKRKRKKVEHKEKNGK